MNPAAAEKDLVRLARDGAVLTVSFHNPPDGLMDARVLTALDGALDAIEAAVSSEEQVRVVVFKSGVPGAFIRHYDVREIGSMLGEGAERAVARAHAVYDRVEALPVPTVAAIDGACMGGGLEFALCCDLRYASPEAGPFGFPEISIGIFPGSGGTQRAARAIGASRALELMLTGRTFGAVEAERLGLVHAVAPELVEHVGKVANRLASRPAAAVGALRVLLGRDDPRLRDGLRKEAELFTSLLREDPHAARLLRQFLDRSGVQD